MCDIKNKRVSENRVLRSMFAPKKDEVIRGARKLQNEELHNLYCSPDCITRMTKSRTKKRAKHVALMWILKMLHNFG